MIERLESGLSADVRQLIAAARGADDPSAEDEARVKARWLASIAAGAGVSSLTEAAHAAAGAGWGLKVAGVAVAIAAASAGLYLGWPATSGDPSGRSVAAPSVAARSVSARDVSAREIRAPEKQAPELQAPSQVAPSQVAPSQAAPSQAAPSEQATDQRTEAAPVVTRAPATGESVAGKSIAGARLVPQAAAEPVAVEPETSEHLAVADGSHLDAAKRSALVVPQGSRVGSSEAVHTQAAPLARAVPSTPMRAASGSSRARLESSERTPAGEGAKVAVAEAVKAPSDVGGQLGEEINMLSRVRTSIQAGESNQALELLGQYGQRFEHPSLAMEADALRIDALCGAGQREAAREHAAHFVAAWPGSPLEQRVRDACP